MGRNLRVFGCDAHVSKDERGKLDSKAKKCVLLGYGDTTKGYRFYDPEKRRIIFSRDVVFYENEKETTESSSDSSSPADTHNDSDKLIINYENHGDQEVPNQEIVETLPQNLNKSDGQPGKEENKITM